MSRIDEALRRAQTETSGDVAVVAPAAEAAIEELAREPFPVEMSERRKLRDAGHHSNVGSAGAGVTLAAVAPAATGPGTPAPAVSAPSVRTTRRAATTTPESNEPLVSVLDRVDRSLEGKTVADMNTLPVSREQYRRLAASLHHMQETNGVHVIMITSASMSEGKTLTSANLALTFSESYQRSVLLIDADLRRPAQQRIFRLPDGPGLSDGLLSTDDRKLPVHQVSPRLAVLAAGRPNADPIAGLTSERMRQVVREARESFDWVIIDTPPVALLPDASLLSGMVDGTVLVVKAASTPYSQVKRAVEAIGRERILGTVLNRAVDEGARAEDYYYNYYADPGGQSGGSS
jgi:capsular exopolysaccharide synthesis family protein